MRAVPPGDWSAARRLVREGQSRIGGSAPGLGSYRPAPALHRHGRPTCEPAPGSGEGWVTGEETASTRAPHLWQNLAVAASAVPQLEQGMRRESNWQYYHVERKLESWASRFPATSAPSIWGSSIAATITGMFMSRSSPMARSPRCE